MRRLRPPFAHTETAPAWSLPVDIAVPTSRCHVSPECTVPRFHASSIAPPRRPADAHPPADVAALCSGLMLWTGCTSSPLPSVAKAGTRIAMHGEPALPEDFPHLPYANPAAPKGGRLVQGVLGTFDSLNPFIVKGIAARTSIRGYVVESLMARGYDEPFTLYGLLARKRRDRRRAQLSSPSMLDPAATILRRQAGHRRRRDVLLAAAARQGPARTIASTTPRWSRPKRSATRAVRFDLAGSDDRELPLILGLMPVLPKHAVDPETFEETTFQVPLSAAAPMSSSKVDPGRSVTLKRDPNYWGRDLPVNRGFWNFDEIRFDYYRDANAYLEAFKRGLYRHAQGTRSRAAGRTATISRLRGTDASSRRRCRPGCRRRAHSSCSTRAGRYSPTYACARRFAAVRFRMDQQRYLLRSLSAHRGLFRWLGAVGSRPACR